MNQEALAMQQLLEHPGWKLLEKRLQTMRSELETLILEGGASQWKEDLLRVKRLNINFLLGMPKQLATAYADQTTEPDTDPYLTIEELELLKKQEQSH